MTATISHGNNALHAILLENGYSHFHHPEGAADRGNAETGPMVDFWPAFDEYLTDEERVIIDASGEIVHREYRDLAFEAWCDDQARNAN